MRRLASIPIGVLCLALAGPSVSAGEPLEIATEPGAETAPGPADAADPPRGPLFQSGKASFDLDAEYRLRNIYINPLELNGTDAVEVAYGVQRLRTGWHFFWSDKVAIHAQLDFLDGVLVGDNGVLPGEDSMPNEGTATGARWPNDSGITTVVKQGATDLYDSDSYTYGLKALEPVKVRRVWGEVNILAGTLRVGRMPAAEGRGILTNDGDNDLNRFGTTGRGNTADRILFGTKPIQVVKALVKGDPSSADSRQDRGLFFGFAYDRLVDDSVQLSGDDAEQFGGSLYYLLPEFELFGLQVRDFKLSAAYAHRRALDAQLKLHAIPLELRVTIENFHLEAQAAFLIGETIEVSKAMSKIGGVESLQDVKSWGLLAIADYDIGPVTLTMEFDYAKGDPDPRPDTAIEEFQFAQDTRVGMLLFPQVLAYETARSAAAATALLKGLKSKYYPSTRIASDGAFRNAIALFPQATWNITDDVFLRVGALFAWAEEPMIDPYETLHWEDGERIDDDAVNFSKGKPGDYYGTEFDLRLSIRLWDHFYFDLEGAALLPGDALEDEHGNAMTSFMLEGRLTFRY